MKSIRKTVQRGFTLLELVVVVSIVGVLIAIAAPNLSGSTDGSKAMLLLKVADNTSQNWQIINQQCGTSSAIGGAVIPAATKTVSDVLFGGSSYVAAAYTTCYAQSKVLPMIEVAQPGTAANTYNIASYLVSFSGGGSSPISVSYAGVPDAIVFVLAQKFNPGLSVLAASDATSPALQYSVAASGLRTVTIIKYF